MSDVVTAIQTAIEIAGKLRNLSKKVGDAEFKMLLADLSGELADAKLEVASLKMELAKAKEQLQQQAERFGQQQTEKPILCEGAYQFPDEPGFFCTACYDTKKQRVRVSALSGPFAAFGKWQCPSCNAVLG
jgi:hypothetical protein